MPHRKGRGRLLSNLVHPHFVYLGDVLVPFALLTGRPRHLTQVGGHVRRRDAARLRPFLSSPLHKVLDLLLVAGARLKLSRIHGSTR